MKIRIAKGAPKVACDVEYIAVTDERHNMLGSIYRSIRGNCGWYWDRYLRDALNLPVFCAGYHDLNALKVELLEAAMFHQKGFIRKDMPSE